MVVRVEPLTSTSSRVVVRARKNLLPKIDVAQQLGMQISSHAVGGQAGGSSSLEEPGFSSNPLKKSSGFKS